jgi:hypothetical protein
MHNGAAYWCKIMQESPEQMATKWLPDFASLARPEIQVFHKVVRFCSIRGKADRELYIDWRFRSDVNEQQY